MRELSTEIVKENLNYLPVGTKVRVRATGQAGIVATVLPDRWGAPYQVHVKLDGEADDRFAPPLILGPHEVECLAN